MTLEGACATTRGQLPALQTIGGADASHPSAWARLIDHCRCVPSQIRGQFRSSV